MNGSLVARGLGLALVMLVARAANAAPFASHGTVAVGAERVFGLEYTKQTVSPPNSADISNSTTSISLLGRLNVLEGSFNPNTAISRLSVDVFLGPGVSVGGALMYQHVGFGGDDDNDNDTGSNLLLLAPRVGYGARLSDQFAIWPRLGITYLHSWSSSTRTDGNGNRIETSSTDNFTLLSLDAMFVYTPMEHVGFTFGPTFDYLLGRSSTTNGVGDATPDTSMYSLGVNAGMLVWF